MEVNKSFYQMKMSVMDYLFKFCHKGSDGSSTCHPFTCWNLLMTGGFRGGVAEALIKIYDHMTNILPSSCIFIQLLGKMLPRNCDIFTTYPLKNQFQESERTMRDSIALASSQKEETETHSQIHR